jgi:hypothetical protein
MSTDPRLPRWSEEGSQVPPELRQWLRASREQLATPDEVAQLSRGLAARLSVAGTASLAPVVAAKTWLSVGPWALWLAAGAGTVGALWYWQSETPWAPSAQIVAAVPAVVPPAVLQPSSALAPIPSPSNVNTPEPAPVLPAPEPAPVPARPRAHAAARAPQTSETELLQRAQRALVDHPSQALALTAEHRRLFAEGALAEEREVITIEALRRLGRAQAAQQRALRFAARYPNSVHRSRVQATPAGP